jgi:hypothetical protein
VFLSTFGYAIFVSGTFRMPFATTELPNLPSQFMTNRFILECNLLKNQYIFLNAA